MSYPSLQDFIVELCRIYYDQMYSEFASPLAVENFMLILEEKTGGLKYGEFCMIDGKQQTA